MTYSVVCPDWTKDGLKSYADGEAWIRSVEKFGACKHHHQIVSSDNDDPDCVCKHRRLRHAADMGFCYDCECSLYRPEA